MCGIAGYYGRADLSRTAITATLERMKQRGPNGQRHDVIPGADGTFCHFLHARLSIIDLQARSDQPFRYKNKTIIFNGEIYNYIEVRDALKKLGHSFTTEGDTEVLIHALDEWGHAALNKIEGMWAFALYDADTQTLSLSRDPFGEKPLYLYQPTPGEIYFGSEVKFLSALSNRRFTPNTHHIRRFLVNGYKALFKTGDEFFLEIKSVPRACILDIKADGTQQLIRYWHPHTQTNNDMSFEDAVSTTRSLLITSVKKRLRSDIPIAFCMSGGIDSNALISIAKRELGYDVHGFTILNTDSRYEEQDMIDIGVRELGLRHNGYPIPSENFIDNMRDLVRYHDAPVITISFYLGWLLQREIAKHGYHISISGTAADEIFSGYFDHQLLYMYDIRHDKAWLDRSIDNWRREIAPIVRNPLLQDPYAFINDPFQREHAYLGREKYSTYLTASWREDFAEIYFREGLLQNRMMNELFHETTPVSLHEDDLNAMYFSIENRAPFLDRPLYEFANTIPARHLIRDGKAKIVLREAMRGIVPDGILDNKRKVGFNAPITDLLKTNQSDVRDYLLGDSPIWDILRREPIEALIDTATLPNSDSKFLFAFLSCKLFLDEFSA